MAQVDRALEACGWPIDEVACGMARGVDLLGKAWAEEAGGGSIPVREFPADWDKHGKGAGFRRNQEMADWAHPDGGLVLVWDGESRGSADMKRRAEAAGLQVFEDRAGRYYRNGEPELRAAVV